MILYTTHVHMNVHVYNINCYKGIKAIWAYFHQWLLSQLYSGMENAYCQDLIAMF